MTRTPGTSTGMQVKSRSAAAGVGRQPTAHSSRDLISRERRDLATLMGSCSLVPAGEMLARNPLTSELECGCAVVDDGHLGKPRHADDHLDDTRVRVTDDQPACSRKLAGECPNAASDSQTAEPRFVPGDRVPCLARQRDHRSQLGARRASHRRQHRDPDTRKIIFVPTKFDDVEQSVPGFPPARAHPAAVRRRSS